MKYHPFFQSQIIIFLLSIILCFFICRGSGLSQAAGKTRVIHLRTEYKINPIGIDVRHPRLSWEIESGQRHVLQTAYQIRSAADPENLRSGRDLLWDSRKTKSDRSIHVEYGGTDLGSSQRIYWQGRIWDDQDHPTAWSEGVFWEMGLLQKEDWTAEWIKPGGEEDVSTAQPCPLLRKEFVLEKKIKSARVYITSLGLYEMFLNGRRVGDQLFTPGWTSYNKRLQYQTYDITLLLRQGKNAAGVILGDGWYRGVLGWAKKRNYYGDKLALLVQIQVFYEDGSSQIITSDSSWKGSTGPILESDIYNGEIYDARLEKDGWDEPDFDDKDWRPVEVIDYSQDTLTASCGPPVRKIEEIKPVKIFKTPKGDTVFDMGQNMVGWVRIKAEGPKGSVVSLRHAEVLTKSGGFYTANLRSAQQRIKYILKGDGQESYEPHFTFQGFRYVCVDEFPGEPDIESLTGIVIHSDMNPTGDFTCSDPNINQLQHNILWGQKGNFLDVPTDCPQRDERMGWTGDAQVFARTACFNMDTASFYTKWLKDLAADQFDSGSIPHVIPDVLGNGGSAAWADAGVIVPWTLYLCYGDKRILDEQYSSMKAWVEFMRRSAGDNFLWARGFHYGDWLAFNTTRSDYPGATTAKDLIATAYFAHSTEILSKTAAVLGKEEDAAMYLQLFEDIKKAFGNEYITPNGRVSSNTQTAYALALAFDLVDDARRNNAAQKLAEDVDRFKHITTGFVGTPLICFVLSENGSPDLAFMLLNRKEYPSWLYPITKGATTIWERWDGIKPDDTFQNAGMNSFNHYAYGAIGDWLYRYVAGIEIDEKNPGYKHILIAPHPGGGLTKASAKLKSMYGEIESSWTIENKIFRLETAVPPNTTATVLLPGAEVEDVREGGKTLEGVSGVVGYSQEEKGVAVKVGSGRYVFSYKWNDPVK